MTHPLPAKTGPQPPRSGNIAPMPDTYEGRCPRCGSDRWVSVSFNEGLTRVPQCVPCGAIHRATLGPGWRAEYERRGREIRAEKIRRGEL